METSNHRAPAPSMDTADNYSPAEENFVPLSGGISPVIRDH